MESGELAGTWNVPGGLQNPHDVAVSADGNIVYVVELSGAKIWKLTNGGSRSTLSPSNTQKTFFQFLQTRLQSLLG